MPGGAIPGPVTCPEDTAVLHADGLGGYECPLCDFSVPAPSPDPSTPPVVEARIRPGPDPLPPPPTPPPPQSAVAEERVSEPVASVLAPEECFDVMTAPVAWRRTSLGTVAGVLGAFAFLVVVLAIVYRSFLGMTARLDSALAQNHLTGPGSVMELLREARASSAKSGAFAAARIRQALFPIGETAFQQWYKDSTPPNWPFMSELYGVLKEVDSSDQEFAAREAYSRAQQHFEARQFSEAWRVYDHALQYKPDWALALNGKAKIHIRDDSPLHDEQAAIRLFEAAIAADTQFAWACKNLGEYYRQRRNWSKAKLYLAEADRRLPGRPTIRQSLDYVGRMEARGR